VNLELVTIGFLGVTFGHASGAIVKSLVSYPWAIMAAYCMYLAAITIWDVSYYLQMVGACLTTALIYIVGAKRSRSGTVRSHIELLGRYSLFGYVAQIAILQFLNISLRYTYRGCTILGASFVAGVALTMISVEAVDRVRGRSRAFDGIYRAVFA
jgi:hypothetical protein